MDFYRNNSSPFGKQDKYASAEECSFNTPDIVRIRRYVTFLGIFIGLLPCLAHLLVLVHLQYVRRSKSFEHLIAIAVLAIVTLIVSASGLAYDLCLLPTIEPFKYFRDNIWLFANNALFCAYAYMLVMLCLDRFVALHKQILYRDVFIKPKVRVMLVIASLIIGSACCCKWLWYKNNSLDKATVHNETSMAALQKLQRRSDKETSKDWFIVVRLLTCIAQYFLPGALMIGLSVSNVQKLRYQEKKLQPLGKLRMTGQTTEFWHPSHETVARVCTIQAVCYCLLNWPYMIVDYLYQDDMRTDIYFGILMIVGNLMQCFYLQLNVFVFAYRSSLYRRTLTHVLSVPYYYVKHLCGHGSQESTPSLHTIIHSTRFNELMAVL